MGKFDLELMSAEATGAGVVRQRVDRSVTFSGEAIRLPIQIAALHGRLRNPPSPLSPLKFRWGDFERAFPIIRGIWA